MCRCTPNIRTPFCGKGSCVPPPQLSRFPQPPSPPKEPTPEQVVRAVISTVVLHALLARESIDGATDDQLLDRADIITTKLIAKAFT